MFSELLCIFCRSPSNLMLVHLTFKNTPFILKASEMMLVPEANRMYFILVLVFVSQHVADVGDAEPQLATSGEGAAAVVGIWEAALGDQVTVVAPL